MKRLFLCFSLFFSFSAQAFDCLPIEWGGDGTSYFVGSTTSGTWYAWNCTVAGKLKANGTVIVSGYKPTMSCLSAIVLPFTDVERRCEADVPELAVKKTRLLRSLLTAQGKLPK
jgi:hypothetical protein